MWGNLKDEDNISGILLEVCCRTYGLIGKISWNFLNIFVENNALLWI